MGRFSGVKIRIFFWSQIYCRFYLTGSELRCQDLSINALMGIVASCRSVSLVLASTHAYIEPALPHKN
jgi:hypothetical protein